ncbi:MAG TPA: hypothetical protein VFH59_03155 [Frateuria sp.]|uniref:hypothetical protein n=1 Tax=Frateuria sp. TaxID=2211372 RepID=UPI002D7F64DD|nr:hypothetical protein [Frateuria sp.]HET6804425.1 hypothetical protein [Frateuria sp.]
MVRKSNAKPEAIVPGGVEDYIARCPGEVQAALNAIRGAAPEAIETVSYFASRS